MGDIKLGESYMFGISIFSDCRFSAVHYRQMFGDLCSSTVSTHHYIILYSKVVLIYGISLVRTISASAAKKNLLRKVDLRGPNKLKEDLLRSFAPLGKLCCQTDLKRYSMKGNKSR